MFEILDYENNVFLSLLHLFFELVLHLYASSVKHRERKGRGFRLHCLHATGPGQEAQPLGASVSLAVSDHLFLGSDVNSHAAFCLVLPEGPKFS